jgi:predicted neuraminidase
VSTDGEHFRQFATIEDGPGQYSYPAMIQGTDGDLQITYSWRRQTIKHVRFPLKEIPK